MAIVQFIFVDALPNLYESFRSVDMWYSIKGDSKVKSVFIVKKKEENKRKNYAILLVQSVQLDLSYRMISASSNTSCLLIATPQFKIVPVNITHCKNFSL